MQHFVANVCRFDKFPRPAIGQIVPTDETFERIIEGSDILEFHVDENNRWHADTAADPLTGDRRYLPSCFSPRQEIYAALDQAWCDAKDSDQVIGIATFTMED